MRSRIKKIPKITKLQFRINSLAASVMRYFCISDSQRPILLGEKKGFEARDNAFELFKFLFESGRKDVFFVIREDSSDLKRLHPYMDQVISYGSLKHYRFCIKSRLIILNDGYKDAHPPYGRFSDSPILFLQHGIIRYKRLFFSSGHYTGRIAKFNYSLRSELDILTERMHSRKTSEKIHRFLSVEAPNFQGTTITKTSLIKLADEFISRAHNKALGESEVTHFLQCARDLRSLSDEIGFPISRVINGGLPRHDLIGVPKEGSSIEPYVLVFFTWSEREWDANEKYEELTRSSDIARLLSTSGLCLKFARHALQKTATANHVENSDLRTLISDAVAVITDYSSISFDAVIQSKPVLFYQPEFSAYEVKRGTYVNEKSGWVGPVVSEISELCRWLDILITNPKQLVSESTESVLGEYDSVGKSRALLSCEIDKILPKITFLVYNIFGIGGTVRTTINLANELYRQGYNVDIISLKKTSGVTKLGLHPAISVKSIWISGSKNILSLKNILSFPLRLFPSIFFDRQEDLYKNLNLYIDISLIAFIRRCRSDYIVTTLPSFARIALLFSCRGTKIIAQEHKFFGSHAKSVQNIIIKHYNKAFCTVVLTGRERDFYSSFLHNVIDIPNGMLMRQNLPEVGSRKKIVSLGRLVESKQFDLLILAFAEICDEHSDWSMDIYGDGPERSRLLMLIKNLKLQDRIFLKGATLYVDFAMDQADIFATTSAYEGFGMVILEAYEAQKPVVTFDIEAGPKEIVLDGITGLKARPFDVVDFGSKLSTLMHNDHMRHTLGVNGRAFLRDNFSIDKVCRKFGDMLISGIASDKAVQEVDLF